jgi:hypothetical protein
MKTKIIVLATLAFSAGMSLTGCDNSSQKTEDTQEELTNENAALQKRKDEYLEEMKSLREETTRKIQANDEIIAEYKSKSHNKKHKDTYNKAIEELEQKNRDMKKRMDEYKWEGEEKWKQFQKEFKHDMDELGKAFEDLAVKNTK